MRCDSTFDVHAKINHAVAVIELLIIASENNEDFFVSHKITTDALSSASESLLAAISILKNI